MVRDWHIVVTAALAMLLHPAAGRAQIATRPQDASASGVAELRSASPPQASNSASIHGVVVDQSGTPLARVRVRVLGPAMVISVTDAEGAFRAEALPHGQYLVRASLPGYTVARSERFELAADTVPSLRLTMVREGQQAKVNPSPAKPTALEAGFGALDSNQAGRRIDRTAVDCG